MSKRSKGRGLPDSVTPQREVREDNDPRVADIVQLMADGKWYAGSSHTAKSKEWDISVDSVEKLATTASKVLRVIVAVEPDAIRARMLCMLEEHRRIALEKVRAFPDRESGEPTWFHPAPDVASANQSVAVQAQLLGLVQTKVNLTVDAQRIAAMTPAERLEECLRVRKDLDAEIASLRAQVKGAA